MSDRTRTLAALMTAPPLLIAIVIAAVELWRMQRPESPLFAAPVAYSLAEAIQRDDAQRAYEFIRAGQNPNDVIPASDAVLTGGRTVLVSPLEWAVANGSRQSALMLIGFGATVDPDATHGAACLADALGRADMGSLLHTYLHTSEGRCPRLEQTTAPLLAFLEPSR